jgi:hypothetical protein
MKHEDMKHGMETWRHMKRMKHEAWNMETWKHEAWNMKHEKAYRHEHEAWNMKHETWGMKHMETYETWNMKHMTLWAYDTYEAWNMKQNISLWKHEHDMT